MYYVKHKNPRVPATDYGRKWAYDGPFSREEAERHVARCEYDVRPDIDYEIIPSDGATNGNSVVIESGASAIGVDDFLEKAEDEQEKTEEEE